MQTRAQIQERLFADPDDAEAHWQMGCVLGYMGEWDRAFDEMEWRMKGHRRSVTQHKSHNKPEWSPGSRGGVLVYQDGGFGDFLMWGRYARMVPNVTLLVEPELYRFMGLQEFDVICPGDSLPRHTHVVAATSLPAKIKTVYNPSAYLVAPDTGKFTKGGVGVAWRGNPDHAEDSKRSCRPEEFLALDRELVSLVVSEGTDLFLDYSAKLTDFYDTAELISSCDSVVTVDTAVAHLAGGLGKETHLVLAYEHDWRWGRDDTTPWYPSMRIWRQKRLGDWREVFGRISRHLALK